MYCGWVFAALTGMVLPAMIWIIGDVMDSFGLDLDPDETRSQIHFLCGIQGVMIAWTWVTGYFYHSLTLTASVTIAATIKKHYLEAILRQECAWFDLTNYQELQARVTKETQAIQKAIGEKFAQVVFSLGMLFAGVFLGFFAGWTLAICMLLIGPMIAGGFLIFTTAITKGVAETVKSYGQSAGYAE